MTCDGDKVYVPNTDIMHNKNQIITKLDTMFKIWFCHPNMVKILKLVEYDFV